MEVHQPGRPVELLLDCLRPKAREHGVAIEPGSTGTLTVTGDAGHGDDLAGYLRTQLDECARLLGIDWQDHLTIAEP